MNKSVSNNFYYTYVFLWGANILQGIFIGTSLSSLIFTIPLYIISIYCTCVVIARVQRIKYINILAVFASLVAIYGLFRWIEGEPLYASARLADPKETLMSVISSMLPIFTFYYFSIAGYVNASAIRKCILLFILISIAEYIYNRFSILTQINSRFDDITNNNSYSILALLPLVCFFKGKKVVKYCFIVIIVFLVIFGMKRGAILCGGIMILSYYYSSFSKQNQRNKLSNVLGFALIVVTIIFIFNFFLLNNEYFQYRVDSTLEMDDSNRTIIYKNLWQSFKQEGNPIIILFGHGADGTLKVGSIHAHQDWLEILTDFGVLGILIYILYWVSFMKVIKNSHYDSNLSTMLLLCFLYTFSRSLFSMSYMNIPFVISLCIGYGMARFSMGLPLNDNEQ